MKPIDLTALLSYSAQLIVVLRLILFQVYAEIQKRTLELSPVREQQSDEQATYSAIAVQVRMNRFELDVRCGCAE